MNDCYCDLLGLPCDCQPRKRGRPISKPCGTLAAYRRHQRHGETPCRECKQAYARWWQDKGYAQFKARKLGRVASEKQQEANRDFLAEELREADGYGYGRRRDRKDAA